MKYYSSEEAEDISVSRVKPWNLPVDQNSEEEDEEVEYDGNTLKF